MVNCELKTEVKPERFTAVFIQHLKRPAARNLHGPICFCGCRRKVWDEIAGPPIRPEIFRPAAVSGDPCSALAADLLPDAARVAEAEKGPQIGDLWLASDDRLSFEPLTSVSVPKKAYRLTWG